MRKGIQKGDVSRTGILTANVYCFIAMVLWASGFPAAELLLESWGAIALQCMRLVLSVSILVFAWIYRDGWRVIKLVSWGRAIFVGGIGFGIGAILLLIGQDLSDPVTTAIAVATMPVAGALVEVVLDKRKLHWLTICAVILVLLGGYFAAGVNLANGSFGLGLALCCIAVFLFAWASRATIKDFSHLSSIGQTATTLVGGMIVTIIIYIVTRLLGFETASPGIMDLRHIGLLFIFVFVSFAWAHYLWIKSVGRLGVFIASFHMNAVPFYVMVLVVLLFDQQWSWSQALGAALVVSGVILSQSAQYFFGEETNP